MPVPIVLDTDIGDDIDDMYALYLALLHPELELRAVTTAHRSSQRKARFVAKALRIAGVTDIPIGAGIDLSVSRQVLGQTDPDPGEMGSHLQWVADTDPEASRVFPRATNVILEQLDRTEEPISLVCIGACSNLADAISQATPEQRSKIRSVARMSGEPTRPIAEHNVVCDPEAADYVYPAAYPCSWGHTTSPGNWRRPWMRSSAGSDRRASRGQCPPGVHPLVGGRTADTSRGLFSMTWCPVLAHRSPAR